MNLRDLEYLVAVAELRHFRKAAERCHVSQPTLSGQLKKLEEELGVALFERTSRKVLLTPAGEALSHQARKVLGEIRELRELARHFTEPLSGQLKIGLIPTVAPYLLPYIIPACAERHPHLELFLHEARTGELLTLLDRGELDLLVLALLPGMAESHVCHTLYHEPFYLALPGRHPATAQDKASLSMLEGEEVLMLAEGQGHCLRDQALGYCFAAGAHEDKRFQATSLETLRHMIGAGRGITLFPALALPPRLDTQAGIHYLPFADPAPGRMIVLLHRKAFARAEVVTALTTLIREQVPAERVEAE